MGNEASGNPYYWVGIGASAGGLEAIQAVCRSLPENTNLIYIIAQHLSPKHNSMMTELIQRHVSLKVETIKDGVEAKPNVIYITPPQKDVYVEGKKIRLVSAAGESVPKPSVNRLLVSLAEEKKEYSVGIVLSGTGSDGAHGIKTIRACGGLTIAQDTGSAKYDGMPKAAIHTDCIDFVLLPSEIGEHLTKISSNLSEKTRLLLQKAEVKDSFAELVTLVRKQCGLSFKDYKKATLQRRIERRMLARGIADFDDYVVFARDNKEEVRLLYKDILISVTDFFRDMSAFEQLQQIISELVLSSDPQETLRIWSVGCATGEEAYTLAIILAEIVGGPEKIVDRNFQIFATDVDADALVVARRGTYSEATMVNVPSEYVKKYFVKSKDSYQVIKPLRDIILFAGHNIIDDPPFLRVDLISCRNLFIYFEPVLQKKVYSIFHYALRQSGYLFLGKSESVTQVSQLFRPLKTKEKIFQKRNSVPNQSGLYIFNERTASNARLTAKPEPEQNNLPIMYESLVKQLGDAAILINDNFNIEHVYGDATPYIMVADGKPAWNLIDIISDVHKQEIRALAFKALRTKTVAEGQPRKIKIDGQLYLDRLKIYPLQADESAERFLLVCFEKLKSVKRQKKQDTQDFRNEKIKELEDELATAREHLQTVIEELETSNEELQSMNEELQSSNEELQSSNEELETTNEELQSTNEELVTINDELNSKTVALEQTTKELVNVKNSLEFPLVVINEKSTILRANKQAAKFFGIEAPGGDFIELIPNDFSPADIPNLIQTALKREESAKVQLQSGKNYYWLHISPFRQHNNEVSGAVLNFIENTSYVKRTRQLLESRKKAQSANIAKSEFLANISHEIRTPLNAICGVTEIFRRNIDNSDKREQLLSILEGSTQNLKALLDDVLDFAKLEAGQLRLEYANYSLRKMIENLINVYSVQASEKDIALVKKVGRSLPDEYIGDSLRIQQVLANLLSNALKFTHEGEVVLEVSGTTKKEQPELQFIVHDTGIGMDEKELATIFEKFTQTDASITRRYGGTGLGLSIVRELVVLMGGKIDVSSKKNSGTEFIVTLPVRHAGKSTSSQDNQHDSKPVIKAEKTEENPVLIVEDNESNIFVVTSFLDELNCFYEVARSGREALLLVKNKNYSFILLDIQMDEMNGFEFFEELKQFQSNTGRLPSTVIAISAHVEKDIIDRCKTIGMDDFLPKPLELIKLRQILSKYIK